MRTTLISATVLALVVLCFNQVSWSETSNPSGKDLTSLLNTMFSDDADFPPRFTNNPSALIENPDITLFISRQHLNAVLEAYLKKPIPLDHKSNDSKNFIRADKLVVMPNAKRNVLLVFLKGGVLHLENSIAGVGGDLKLNHAEFELAPICKINSQKQVVLETRIRCVGLDINGTAQAIDIGIAHLLQDLYLDKQPIEPINLSDLIPSLKDKKGAVSLSIQLGQASVLMQTKGIEIRSSWTVR